MSGRRLGRLFGSLLLVAALAAVVVLNPGVTELHLTDVIWM
jgi:hypothetical protein